MNPLLRWLTSPEWAHVVATLLHSLWQGAIVALALAVLMRRLTNPLTRYRFTISALGMIVVASIVTWAVLNTPQSPAPPTAPAAALNPIAESTSPNAFASNSADKVVVTGQMTRPETQTNWTAWLALIWMTGALVMLVRASIKIAGAETLRRSCQPLKDEPLALLVAEACRAVGLVRKIRVAVTDKLTSPAVVGVLVPTLILPLSLFTTLTPAQIQFVLLHELAHIRRGDYLANLFQLFAEALLFFNPAIWWISHQIRREREACCDALAIELSGAPADYAKTLVRVAENILQPTTHSALAFGEDGREPSSLADRVQRLLVPGYRPALRLTWRAMVTSLLVGVALLMLSAVGTRNTVGAILTSSHSTNSPVLPRPGIDPDLQPRLPGDDATIQTTLIPTLTEFVGYDLATAATFVPTPVTQTGQVIDSVLPLPIFRVRQITTSNNVGDVQTNELGRLHSKIKDKVPFLGDLPLVGKLFTSESSRPSPVPAFRVNDSFDIDDWTVTENERLNKQWFWFLGGDTITWPTAATINTATAEPLAQRVFDVDLGLLYAAVRKSAGLSETVTVTNLFSAVRSYFTNAGVNLDPTSGRGLFLSTTRGDMWVRATTPELDAIETLLRPMPGTPLTRRSYHFDSNTRAKVNAVLSPEIAAIVATNPAAGFRALLESFNPNDPRPKQVRYLAEHEEIYARATAADFEKFESALKVVPLPRKQVQLKSLSAPDAPPELATRTFVVGPMELAKALGRTGPLLVTNTAEMVAEFLAKAGLDLQPPKSVFFKDPLSLLLVRATPAELDALEKFLAHANQETASAQPTTKISDSESSVSSFPSSTNLHARTFAVDMNALTQAVTQRLGTNMFSPDKPNEVNWPSLLRQLFAAMGVDLELPKSLYLNDRKGELVVRATLADLDAIETFLQVLNYQAPQVNIKVRWIEIPTDTDLISLLLRRPTNAIPLPVFHPQKLFGILTEAQTEEFLQRLRQDKRLSLVSEGQVTTLSARQAQLQVAEVKTIMTGIRPEALTPPGVVATNTPAAAALNAEVVPLGPVLNVTPCVSSDQNQISLHLEASTKEFLGYDQKAPTVLVYINGQKGKTTLPLPKFLVRQMTNDCVLRDGQTLVLGHLPTTEIATQPDGTIQRTDLTATKTNNLCVLVTATLIDPAGNRLNPPK